MASSTRVLLFAFFASQEIIQRQPKNVQLFVYGDITESFVIPECDTMAFVCPELENEGCCLRTMDDWVDVDDFRVSNDRRCVFNAIFTQCTNPEGCNMQCSPACQLTQTTEATCVRTGTGGDGNDPPPPPTDPAEPTDPPPTDTGNDGPPAETGNGDDNNDNQPSNTVKIHVDPCSSIRFICLSGSSQGCCVDRVNDWKNIDDGNLQKNGDCVANAKLDNCQSDNTCSITCSTDCTVRVDGCNKGNGNGGGGVGGRGGGKGGGNVSNRPAAGNNGRNDNGGGGGGGGGFNTNTLNGCYNQMKRQCSCDVIRQIDPCARRVIQQRCTGLSKSLGIQGRRKFMNYCIDTYGGKRKQGNYDGSYTGWFGGNN